MPGTGLDAGKTDLEVENRGLPKVSANRLHLLGVTIGDRIGIVSGGSLVLPRANLGKLEVAIRGPSDDTAVAEPFGDEQHAPRTSPASVSQHHHGVALVDRVFPAAEQLMASAQA